MSVEIQFEPLTEWPLANTKNRRGPQFRTGYDKTLRELRYEVEAIGGKGAIAVQVVTRNGRTDLRRDGMLAARADVIHPGCRISFESKFGPLTYASDAFAARYYNDPPSWQSNLRAIVLGLEALRAVDRYGITRSGEQYRGWQQIAARVGSSVGMGRDVALAVLREESGDPTLTFLDTAPDNLAWRLAKKNAHPDSNNGDRRRWDALAQAAAALGVEF